MLPRPPRSAIGFVPIALSLLMMGQSVKHKKAVNTGGGLGSREGWAAK